MMGHQAGQGPQALHGLRIVFAVSAEARLQSCMTRGPATYQARFRSFVPPSALDGAAGSNQQTHPQPSIEGRHSLPSEGRPKTLRPRCARSQEPTRSDTTPWLSAAGDYYLGHLESTSHGIALATASTP